MSNYRDRLSGVRDKETFDELAGKYEHDAGMSQAGAEARAYGDVMVQSVELRRQKGEVVRLGRRGVV